MSKPGSSGIEALDQLLAAGGRDAGHGPAVEGALEGDDAVPLGRAQGIEVAADHLDRGLDRLRTRIADEHRVGEGVGDQPVGQALELGDLPQVGDVPEPGRLLGHGRHQMRMGVAESGDGDARAEIQHATAVESCRARTPRRARRRGRSAGRPAAAKGRPGCPCDRSVRGEAGRVPQRPRPVNERGLSASAYSRVALLGHAQ